MGGPRCAQTAHEVKLRSNTMDDIQRDSVFITVGCMSMSQSII